MYLLTYIRQEIMSLKFPSTPGNDGEIIEQVITMKESNSCEKTLKEKSKKSQ